MIRFNLKLAIRNLLRNKMYSTLIIGGFAIGFASCILIGLYYHTEKTVNEGFANYKEIYRLYDIKKNRCNINYDLLPLLLQNFAEVEDACPLGYNTGYGFTVKNEQTLENTQIQHLLTTTNNFFSIFSVDVIESLSNKPFDGKESVVLSKSVAKRLFGTQNPLGQSVNLNNYFSATVTGIINDLPANSSFQADVILNAENEKYRMSSTIVNGRRYNSTNLFVLMKEGADLNLFSEQLNSKLATYDLDIDSVGVQNLADIYLSTMTMKSSHAKGNPMLLKIFLAIALLIILLSSINYLNYAISMQYAKLKEIGINKTNGASWRHLINYSFIEVSLGIFISLVLAFIITLIALPYSKTLFGKALTVNPQDIVTLGPVFLGTIISVILMNSLAPMYILSKFKITEFLSGFGKKRNRKQFGKQAMLTFQFTTSIALIAVVIVIFKQLSFVKNSDLGFDRELLLRIDIPYQFPNTETLKQETEKLPFVKSSTISVGCPGMINNRLSSNTGEDSFTLNCIYVGDDYLKTMGVELLEGRDFHDGDANKVCLMNQKAIKQYQWESIEGKKFKNGPQGGYDVIGVVNDFNVKSFHSGIEPLALIYSTTQENNVFSVKLAPGNFKQQVDQIKQIWEKLALNEPMNFSFYDDQFQAMYSREEKLASSITFFSIIAIALTCMGILGQIFMICLNRVKEVGVRKVNGAKISEILVLLNRDFVKWVIVAFIIATPIAWYAMHRWLETFAYKTELSWWVFALSGMIALGIALFTVSWQSWRAATRNPVEALRYE
jgi:putative ABC transport system permease protein